MIDEARRRAVQGCLRATRGTVLAADFYEMRLLVHYIQGSLTIDQVCRLLDARPPRFPRCLRGPSTC